MENNNLLGYNYDENNNLVINDEHKIAIEATYDLRSNYSLEIDEIYYLYKGVKIYDIISSRIHSIYDTLEKYDNKIKNEFNDINISEILINKIDIQNNILEPLSLTKKELSKYNESDYKFISNKIDDTIYLISQIDNILEKYGDFKKINFAFNDYIISKTKSEVKNPIEDSMSPNKSLVEFTNIISEDQFKMIKDVLDTQKNNLSKDNEI